MFTLNQCFHPSLVHADYVYDGFMDHNTKQWNAKHPILSEFILAYDFSFGLP